MNTTDMNESAAVGLPRLNEPAPDFRAETTCGERCLSDYRGRWLLLFSHPSDFTPVCTTEFVAFARAFPQFEALGCELLGLSIDSVFSHIAWVRNIEETFEATIPFPIIADLSMAVARAYGMIQPGASTTEAVRAVFIIDPDGILRTMLYYPMSTGRSIPELVRVVQALQMASEHKVATPEGWQPGDDVIVPPPRTVDVARERFATDPGCKAWYFTTRSAETVKA